jgi:hypothetical protein
MNAMVYYIHYLRSPLGLATLGAAVAAGAATGSIAGALPGLATGVVAYGLLLAAALKSGLAAKAAAREAERLSWLAAKEHLERARGRAELLERLRTGDDDFDAVVRAAAFAARAYVDRARREKSRDPLAEEAIDDAVELTQLRIKSRDAAARSDRFGADRIAPDGEPDGSALPAGEERRRLLAELRDRAARIEHAEFMLAGGLSRADRLSIKETLP